MPTDQPKLTGRRLRVTGVCQTQREGHRSRGSFMLPGAHPVCGDGGLCPTASPDPTSLTHHRAGREQAPFGLFSGPRTPPVTRMHMHVGMGGNGGRPSSAARAESSHCVIWESMPATNSAPPRVLFAWAQLLWVGLPLRSRGRRAGATILVLPHVIEPRSAVLSFPMKSGANIQAPNCSEAVRSHISFVTALPLCASSAPFACAQRPQAGHSPPCC